MIIGLRWLFCQKVDRYLMMEKKYLRILIVDDNDVDRNVYRRYINSAELLEADIFEADTAQMGLENIATCQPDCILLDYNLPDFSGIEFLSKIHCSKEAKPPIIMLTGEGLSKIALKAIEYGAHDYLVKSQESLERLWLTILNAVEKDRLTKELQEKHSALEKLAYFDQLTGLCNRASFTSFAKKSISSAIRHKHLLALLLIDLDNFKHVNDTLGHGAGDLLLKQVADRIKKSVRTEDHIARIGGDEFVLMLTEIRDSRDAGIIADKLIKIITPSYNLQGNTAEIGASIGIANFPEFGRDLEELTKNADMAMYKAKNSGKNQYQFYTKSLSLESNLKKR